MNPMHRRTYHFKIAKNLDKGGAWLASYSIKEPDVANDGSIKGCAAFSSAAPAKRWTAAVVGRNRLTWDVTDDKKSMTATLEVKAS